MLRIVRASPTWTRSSFPSSASFGMPPKHRADESAFTSTERIMQTFRLPRELVTFLKDEATRGGRDLTSHVMRWLEGIRTWFGLPMAATALLEADREALGLERSRRGERTFGRG